MTTQPYHKAFSEAQGKGNAVFYTGRGHTPAAAAEQPQALALVLTSSSLSARMVWKLGR